MRALCGELLLIAWETGACQHSLDRALTLLTLGLPERMREDLAELPISIRNRLLLQLREATFGPLLKGFTVCSHCASQMEFSLPVDVILSQTWNDRAFESVEWSIEGTQFHLRPVNTTDLLASLEISNCSEAQDLILSRCLTPEGCCRAASPGVLDSALQKFDELNGSAEIRAGIECPSCSTAEILDLDIAWFLWLEVRNAALRLLREIHDLAATYGWSESSILSMSTRRRAAYLEMLSA